MLVIHSLFLSLSGFSTIFLLLFVGPLAWILRDGLGPEATDSAGWNAIRRMFWTFYWGPATLTGLVMLLTAALFRPAATPCDAPESSERHGAQAK